MNRMTPRRVSSVLRAPAFAVASVLACLGAVTLGVTVGHAPADGARVAAAPAGGAPVAAVTSTSSGPASTAATTVGAGAAHAHQHAAAASTSAPTTPSAASAQAHHHATSSSGGGGSTTSPSAPSPPAHQHSGGIQGVLCGGWINRRPPPAHMIVDDSTGGRTPTATDCANARAFYNAVVAANSKYADINVAIAAGFKPGGDPAGQYAQHYVQWGPSPWICDPTRPEGLVYHFDSSGHATLLGVMFVEQTNNLPQPGGPITVWHHHHSGNAGHMLHVWMFPGVRDPFALMISSAT